MEISRMVGLTFSIAALLTVCAMANGQFKDKQKVVVFVNKVGPYSNPHETYHYFQLPVCRPKKVVHKSLSLGEVLDGDRMAESLYEINFKENKPMTELCAPFKLEGQDHKQLLEAIEENYYFEFNVDDLPLRNFVGYLEEEGLFPHTHKVFVYTNHHFIFEYNKDRIISAKVDVARGPTVRLEEEPSEAELKFTYSVEWKETTVEYKDRDKQDEGSRFFPKSLEIHWLSVINSTLLVFLLMGFVVLILFRVVRNDLTRYNEGLIDAEKEDKLDNGWKVVHGDVFRFPKFPNLFCAVLGVGYQLLTIVCTILVISAFSLLNVHRHGLINTAAVVLYALTSCVAGYVSASMYRRMHGTQWVLNINLVSGLFSGPMFIVWCIENSFFWGYQSTQALPVTTIILLLAVWVCVGYPLTVVGGIMGKNYGGKWETPCRTRNIPREIPELPWYQSVVVYCIVGGFLPFSAISVELYYLFATAWGHEPYTLYGILLLVFAILLSVTACVSVALTYFQLAAEDYRWWWRSIFTGGSTGFFVFLYSLFFYFKRSQMTGVLQTVQYFGYVGIICYAFFLLLGTVSFFASLRFTRFIYGSVKTD